MKNLAIIVTQIGIIITFAAIFWWHSFYRVVAQQLVFDLGESDPTLGSGLRCLFSTAGHCGEIIDYAESLGKTVYTPTLFWSGITMIVSGLIVLLVQQYRNRSI